MTVFCRMRKWRSSVTLCALMSVIAVVQAAPLVGANTPEVGRQLAQTQDPAWGRLVSPIERAAVWTGIGDYEKAVRLLKQWQPQTDAEWVTLDRAIAAVFRALGQPEKSEAYLDEAQTLLKTPDAGIARQRIDAQLAASRWDAAADSLVAAKAQSLLPAIEQAAWQALLSTMRSGDTKAPTDLAWNGVIATWQALSVDSPALGLIAAHVIDAKQTALLTAALDARRADHEAPPMLAIKASVAKQSGDIAAARDALLAAAQAYQRVGLDGDYLIHALQAQALTGDAPSHVPADEAEPLRHAETPDMRLTRRGAFLQDSARATPYFKPLAPKSFERFPFPGGTAVRGASGVVVDGGRRVLTNRHVIEGGHDFAIRTGLGEVSKARVVFMSETDDLAILELDKPLPAARAVELADLRMAQPGSQVVAMGYPLWYLLGSQTPSLTNGVVAKAAGINEDPKMFQLTAKINRGNSGGPVFDMRGHLVGLTMGKLDNEALRLSEGIMPEDINFAIQADRIRAALTGQQDPLTPAMASEVGGLKPPEQIYREMLGRVVIVAVAVK